MYFYIFVYKVVLYITVKIGRRHPDPVVETR